MAVTRHRVLPSKARGGAPMMKIRFDRTTVTTCLLAAALVWAPAASAFFAGGGKDAAKGNDCLVGYDSFFDAGDVTLQKKKQIVTCTDCDPACDIDGVAEPNGSCTIDIGVCINQSGVDGCTPGSTLSKVKAKGKIKGVKGSAGKILIPVPLEGSACGAHVDAVIPINEKKGQGSAKLNLNGKVKKSSAGPGRKDVDKLTLVCQPLPACESCRAPTSTTTTVTPTSPTAPPCGNGTVDAGEECDFNASPSGCNVGLTCINDCTCQDCVEPGVSDPASLIFRTGAGTTDCGSVGLPPSNPADPPFAGELQDGAGATLNELGLGCLYIGGGNSTVPGGVTPDNAPNTYAVDLICNAGDQLILQGSPGTSSRDCSLGAGPTRFCANGHPGTNGEGACTVDADCRPICAIDGNLTQTCSAGQTCHCQNGAPGTDDNGLCTGPSNCGTGAEGCLEPGCAGLVCLPVANCYFGPPLPVVNGALSTCVANVFDTDGSGTAEIAAGNVSLDIPLLSRVHFTSSNYPPLPGDPEGTIRPCPACVDGTCNAGPNLGQACTGVGQAQSSHDCPPDPFFLLAPLSVTLSPL